MSSDGVAGVVDGIGGQRNGTMRVEVWGGDGIPDPVPVHVPVSMLESLPDRLFDRLTEDLLALSTAGSDGIFRVDAPTDPLAQGGSTVYCRVFDDHGLLAAEQVSLRVEADGPDLVIEPTDTSRRAVPAAGTALAAVVAGCSGLPGADEGTASPESATDTPGGTSPPAATDTTTERSTPANTVTEPSRPTTAGKSSDPTAATESPTEGSSSGGSSDDDSSDTGGSRSSGGGDGTDDSSTPTPTPTPTPSSGDSEPDLREPDPPDPDLTTTSSTADRATFLYQGSEPVQRDADPAKIEERRVSTLAGTVLTRDGSPLSGVKVSVKDRPEFGHTYTREDGKWDMALNGGGRETLRFEKDGYLPAQRSVNLRWNQETAVDDVVLVDPDGEGTEVENDADESQIVESAEVSDGDGTRKAVVFIPEGTAAQWTADGTAPESLTIRTAEYTVGDSGPESMPADLPSQVGYTYASEFFVDEEASGSGGSSGGGFIGADSAGDLQFDKDVVFYLENFLDFPVGNAVPVGSYDADAANWVPSGDGRVVKIHATSDGKVDLDVDGSGTAADEETLSDLGVGDAEREELADLYEVGDELWRTPLPHFTPWDCNWSLRPPDDAERPPEQDGDDEPTDPDDCYS